jgi:putative peptidoglycan lipid II flippase
MSVMELSLVIDTQFASWLPSGSVALIYYANRFMGIPLGVFVTAFSTILLPHFSHIVTYAPKRLSFYLLEATKLIFWVTIPVTFLMIFFSKEIFITVFLSDKFPMDKVLQASNVLIAFMIGLPFFSMNRILLNLYYALHNTFVPAVVSIIATVANITLNWLLIDYLQAPGLALATVISAFVQTSLYLWYLYRYQNFTFYFKNFAQFSFNYAIQLLVIGTLFICSYYTIYNLIDCYFSCWLAQWLLNSILLWFWVGPLLLAVFMALYYFRASFNVKLYFLD